jgi:N-glycosidase YbiA
VSSVVEADPVDFYGGPFSNFATSPIGATAWGVQYLYPTVEHYFQAHKATCRADHDRVLAEHDCWAAKGAGRSIPLRADWEEVKYEVMLSGLRAKFEIPYYREQLLDTGNREIREDSPTDFEWGYRNGGQNLLGKALMQVRAEIRLST